MRVWINLGVIGSDIVMVPAVVDRKCAIITSGGINIQQTNNAGEVWGYQSMQ
jgi:hypothetical protein